MIEPPILFLGAFANFFTNILNIVIGLIFLAVGILVGVILIRYGLRPKNQILYCRERDGRGHELNVQDEDAISLETSSKPVFRFFKYGRAYEFIRRGRAFTRFFGKEGTAYTWRLQGFSKKKKIDLEFPTLEDAVKFRWGKEAYEQVPKPLQKQLQDDKIYVTVNLEQGIVPEGYTPITESVVRKKANEDVAGLIGEGLKGSVKQPLFEKLAYVGTGIAIGFAIYIFMLAG